MHNERTAFVKWREKDVSSWVHRPELARIKSGNGNLHACAKVMQKSCPQGYRVDNRQLARWIGANKPWTCWIPNELNDAALDYVKKFPPDGPDSKTSSTKPTEASREPGPVELAFVPDVHFRRDDEFGETFLNVVDNFPPIEPGTSVDINCKVVLLCKPVGSKRWIGIANAQIRVDAIAGDGSTLLEGVEETWREAGVTFQRVGGGGYMAVNIRSGGAIPLILSAMKRSGDQAPLVVPVARFRLPKPGRGFSVSLLVSFQNGFVWGPEPIPTAMSSLGARESEFENLVKDRVLEHCAKLASGLAPEAEIVELSKDGWCFKRTSS